MRLLAALFVAVVMFPVFADEPRLGQGQYEYCESRGKLALDMARDHLQQNIAFEAMEIAWPTAAQNAGETQSREAWWQALKDEVRNALESIVATDQKAERAAQRVMESCAYDIGLKRKDVQASPITRVASSAHMKDANWYKAEWCYNIGQDAMTIIRAKGDGMSQREMTRLATDHALFSPGRRAEVLSMIDEAFRWQGAAEDWFNAVVKDCAK